MTQNISELNLAPITNEKLVNFINYQLPINNKDLKVHILKELKRRKLEYRHLLNSKSGELDVKFPLSLIDGCLFERNITKPPLIANFYFTVNRLKHFLANSDELKNKKLKTFDYIHDQLFIEDDIIEIINEDDINNLTENDAFIIFKNLSQQFPNQSILNKISLKSSVIVIDKGNFYRGLKNVSILKDEYVLEDLTLL